MNATSRRRRTVFSIEEANQTLPLVRAIASDIVELWGDLLQRRERLSIVLCDRDIERNDVYSQELADIERGLQQDTKRLEGLLKELKDLGLVPGGPEGNVGFPTILDGKRVLLSWKLGEDDVAFWHDYDQEYDQRQPLAAVDNENGIFLDVN